MQIITLLSSIILYHQQTVPWLRWSHDGLLLWRPRFTHWPVVYQMALRQVLLCVLHYMHHTYISFVYQWQYTIFAIDSVITERFSVTITITSMATMQTTWEVETLHPFNARPWNSVQWYTYGEYLNYINFRVSTHLPILW